MRAYGMPVPSTGTLTTRQWLLVGMAIFVLLTVLFYHATNLLVQAVAERLPQSQSQQPKEQNQALDSALRQTASSPASWRDPAWQELMRNKLASLGIGILIESPSGGELFRAGNFDARERPSRQIAVVQAGADGGQPLGTVALFAREDSGSSAVPLPLPVPLPAVAAVAAIALALLFVRMQMGAYLVKPLEALAVAARRIADGNLDFELPQSRVRELADVNQAFRAMGEGLRDSLKRQAEIEEERRFFIGAIAHDLRTPLFSLRGYLEGLEHGLASSPEKAAGYVTVCRQKADQLDRLVSDLSAYTRVEYLEQTLQWGPVDLVGLLQRVVEGATPLARDKGITVELEGRDDPYEGSEPCRVEGDEQLLERAVENLFENALRYTPEGGKVEVRWHRDEAGGEVQFTIADTGPGIEPSDMPHLFDPLYRGETSRNRQTGGAGLGLAIARRALMAHHGDLLAANRSGGGAQFTGRLPLILANGTCATTHATSSPYPATSSPPSPISTTG